MATLPCEQYISEQFFSLFIRDSIVLWDITQCLGTCIDKFDVIQGCENEDVRPMQK